MEDLPKKGMAIHFWASSLCPSVAAAGGIFYVPPQIIAHFLLSKRHPRQHSSHRPEVTSRAERWKGKEEKNRNYVWFAVKMKSQDFPSISLSFPTCAKMASDERRTERAKCSGSSTFSTSLSHRAFRFPQKAIVFDHNSWKTSDSPSPPTRRPRFAKKGGDLSLSPLLLRRRERERFAPFLFSFFFTRLSLSAQKSISEGGREGKMWPGRQSASVAATATVASRRLRWRTKTKTTTEVIYAKLASGGILTASAGKREKRERGAEKLLTTPGRQSRGLAQKREKTQSRRPSNISGSVGGKTHFFVFHSGASSSSYR